MDEKHLKITPIPEADIERVLFHDYGLPVICFFTYSQIESSLFLDHYGELPSFDWVEIDFYDKDEKRIRRTLLPHRVSRAETYTVSNLFGTEVEHCSLHVISVMIFFTLVSILLEKNADNSIGEKMDALLQGLYALAYSSEFLNEEERTQFFNFTD